MFSSKNILSVMQHYFYGSLLYGAGLYFCLYNSYYTSFLKITTKDILVNLYIAYLIIAPFMFFFDRKKDISAHKPYLIFGSIKRNTIAFAKYIGSFGKKSQIMPFFSHREKTAILFMLVKLFYLPLMLNFLIGNYHSFFSNVGDLVKINSIETMTYAGYTFALSFIFFVDVAFFSFGYMFEAKYLKNKVRSVEPTLIGWAVALACYPPFNTTVTKYVGWSANDYIMFSTLNITFIARTCIVLLLLVYLWATISLWTKCSNLTNRGIVAKGAYKYVRHPAYISKNLAWWITVLPVMSISAFIAMSVWSFIYYLRTVTEERHLMIDPDYQKYCKKTKYMFIPYVW